MKIFVVYGRLPVVHINGTLAVYRDRDENGETFQRPFSDTTHVELTPELKQTLLEDLAYFYGNNSKKFTEKLKEFNLLQ